MQVNNGRESFITQAVEWQDRIYVSAAVQPPRTPNEREKRREEKRREEKKGGEKRREKAKDQSLSNTDLLQPRISQPTIEFCKILNLRKRERERESEFYLLSLSNCCSFSRFVSFPCSFADYYSYFSSASPHFCKYLRSLPLSQVSSDAPLNYFNDKNVLPNSKRIERTLETDEITYTNNILLYAPLEMMKCATGDQDSALLFSARKIASVKNCEMQVDTQVIVDSTSISPS